MNYFDTKAYLNEYYSEVSPENKAILEFFAEVAQRNISRKPRHLELGCGPTIYQVLSIAPQVCEIVYTDGFQESLDEIKRWLNGHEQSFNWNKFTHATLSLENGKKPSEHERNEREDHVKSKIRKHDILDISNADAISDYMAKNGPFGSVSSVFALEVPAKDNDHLESLLQAIYNGLPSGGVFNLVMVEGGKEYKVGETYLRNLKIGQDEIKNMLTKVGFKVEKAILRHISADRDDEGYKGIMMISILK